MFSSKTLTIIATTAVLSQATTHTSSFITSDKSLSVANGGPGNCLYSSQWGDNYLTNLSVDTRFNADFRPLSLHIENVANQTGAMVITVMGDNGVVDVRVPFEDTDGQAQYAKLCVEETGEPNADGQVVGKLVFYQQRSQEQNQMLRHYTISEYAFLQGYAPFRMEFMFNSYVVFRDNSDKQEVIAALH